MWMLFDRGGWTALMLAALNGHTATVTALAGTHGANVDAVDRFGRTALMLAAKHGHTATVTALAGSHGANVDACRRRWHDGVDAMPPRNGHTDTVNALAGTHGADVEAVDNDGRTALMYAAKRRRTATVNALKALAQDPSPQ